jgi:TonB-linked SusC/RagA family outer membrane protein
MFMEKLYKSLSVLLLLLVLSSATVMAQRTVTGTILDEFGDGLPGVTVLVKGTTTGTATDIDGNFSLNVPSNEAVLVFSFIGYTPVEQVVGNRSVIDFAMQPDERQLTELIVTGYTIDSRRETTGAISTVDPKDLTIIPTGNIEQTLQGRIAGVTVVTNGQPGTQSQIRVRGFGAFGGNEPLYIVDGVPVGNTDFLNPDDIESTTVLKDAAAASIYGARAANGVIIYTTKRGRKGAQKLRFDYNGMVGFTDPGVGLDMANPQEYADITWLAETNQARIDGRAPAYGHPQLGNGARPVLPYYINVGGQAGVAGPLTPAQIEEQRALYNIDPRRGAVHQLVRAATGEGTDWFGAVTRRAPLQRHSLGFSGGSETSRFFLGLGIQDQAGILIGNDFRRISLRANSEHDLGSKVRVGQNFQATYRQVLGQTGAGGGQRVAQDENDILQAFRMPSIIPVRDEFGGYAGTAARGFNNPRNPVANREGQLDNRNFNANAFDNIYVEFEPVKDLVFRSSIGGQYNNFYGFGFGRLQYENSENNSAFSYNEFSGYSMQWVLTNTAQWKKTIDRHQFDVLIGQEALNTGAGRNMNTTGQNPFSEDPNFVTITNLPFASRIANSGQFLGVNFLSVFSRVNYTYNDKYLFSAVVRRDGSSRFGPNTRWGTFPAFSAAWRLTSEEFMSGVTWLDDLKIRGGWGQMGNSNNVDPNNQFSLFGGDLGASSYDIAGTNSSALIGFRRTRIGNPNARWETAVTKNIGFDGSAFGGKLDVIVDLWQKDTRDLLFSVPIPSVAGFNAAAPSVNIGEMMNRGVDVMIATRGNLSTDWTYELQVNGGFLQNEIVFLAPGLDFITSGNANPSFRGIQPIRNQVGQPISSFFGYQVDGLFQSAEDVANHASQDGAAPGRFKYRDVNGDGVIDPDDRVFLGSPVPKFSGGMNFTVGYKNFDLSAYFFGTAGNKIWAQWRWFTDFFPTFEGASVSRRLLDSWTPDNPNTTIPVADKQSSFSSSNVGNSYYVVDGSYLRLQNLTLGYTMPNSLLQRWKLERLRVFVSGNNLLTITGYDGLDPMVGGNVDLGFGIDVGNYPVTRQYTVGVNLSF